MQRYFFTKEIVGSILYHALSENKAEVAISDINSFARIISKEIQSECNVVVDYSTKDVYAFVNNYNKYFYLNSDRIVFSEYTQTEMERDSEKIKDIFDTKFIAGLPEDIVATIGKISFKYR